MCRNRLTIELVGGLGNQLFGYFAGMYLSHTLGRDFVPYVRKVAKKESSHGSSLTSFTLDYKLYGRNQPSIRIESIVRQAIHLVLTSRIARRVGLRDFSGLYVSNSLGADTNLLRVSNLSYVRGYFQTYKYFDYLQQRGLVGKVGLNKASDWFRGMASQMDETKPLVMHVRRGDFFRPENDFMGILLPEYFLEALSQLRSKEGLSERQVWIFSDDVPKAKSDFQGYDLGPHKWIIEPDRTDAAETMILMGMGAGIVTSNSTFSWWAAKLGRTKFVVAPTPWFKDHPEPLDIIRPDWLRQQSRWAGESGGFSGTSGLGSTSIGNEGKDSIG
jgi:hypothetical protein